MTDISNDIEEKVGTCAPCSTLVRVGNNNNNDTSTTTITQDTNVVEHVNQSENDVLFEEWKTYLQSDRSDLLLAATEAVVQLPSDTFTNANMLQQCIQHGFIPLLAKHVSYTTQHPQYEMVSVNALRALLYLSSVGMGSTNQCIHDLLVDASGLNRMLEIVLSKPEGQYWHTRVNYAMALLANMTRVEIGAMDLVGRSLPDEPIFHTNHKNNHDDYDDDDDVTNDTTARTTNNIHEKLPTKPTLELLLAKFMNPSYRKDDTDVDYVALMNDDYEDEEVETTGSDTAKKDSTNDISGSHKLDAHDHDPYQHFAAILLNATQTEAGRQFVLKIHAPKTIHPDQLPPSSEQGWTVLQTVLSQLRSPNPIRRRGIAGTIRNICTERDSAWWLLNVIQINYHLLYPLAGPEELDLDDKQGLHVDLWIEGPDKVREPDRMTRLFLAEAILLLLSTGRVSRETMRLQRTYVILKMADLVEEHEDVSSLIYDCVNYLRRDEEGTPEGSSDALIEQTYPNQKVSTSSGSNNESISNGNKNDDFDNVD